jgi:hypothetical protein
VGARDGSSASRNPFGTATGPRPQGAVRTSSCLSKIDHIASPDHIVGRDDAILTSAVVTGTLQRFPAVQAVASSLDVEHSRRNPKKEWGNIRAKALSLLSDCSNPFFILT